MSGLSVAEFTDPMCPWAWGSEPAFRALRGRVADRSRWRRVYGILFDTDDDPAPDPDAETAWYFGHITQIAGHTGAPVPPRLLRVAATSWPSSLAAKAAEAQGFEVADRVLDRLRETMFVQGDPADTPERVIAAVRQVEGLDVAALERAAASAKVLAAVRRDRRETRRPVPEVVGLRADGPHCGAAKRIRGGVRYALPTLLFEGPLGRAVVPGWRTPAEYADAAERVAPGSLVS